MDLDKLTCVPKGAVFVIQPTNSEPSPMRKSPFGSSFKVPDIGIVSAFTYICDGTDKAATFA